MIKTISNLFLSLTIFFISASSAIATEYYVAGDTGLDTNNGSISTPWQTIQKAADTMVAGDTVNVKGGITYTGSNSCVSMSSEVAVVCLQSKGTVGNYITYRSWQGTGFPIIDANGITGNGIATRRTVAIHPEFTIIEGFKFINTSDPLGDSPGLIYISRQAHDFIVRNNIFLGRDTSIRLAYTGPNNQVYNNIVSGISESNFLGSAVFFDFAGTSVFKNNIILDSNIGIEDNSGTIQYDYNLLFNNSINYTGTSQSTHDIVGLNPEFVDPSHDDFSLQKSSPAIGAGADLSASGVTTDILGVSRPQGSGYDIGAYEYYDIPVNLTTTPATISTDTTPTIEGTASTIGAATISSVTYSVDGGSWVSTGVTGTSSFSIVIPALADGSHTVRVRATDSYGNITDSTLYGSTTFTVDTTAPTSPVLDSPSGYTKDATRPSLVWKLDSLVSSYSLSLDSAKNKSYHLSGIPSTGTGTWRDDNDVKVEFESDSKISVYFKGLNNQELTEGKHSWTVTAYDSAGNSTTSQADFLLDRTSPSLSGLSIANLTSVTNKGEYQLPLSMIQPELTGHVVDEDKGSDKENDNGTKDSFDKVSSGLDKLTFTISQLQANGTYLLKESNDYHLDSSDFYLKTQHPLLEGTYEVNLIAYDKAGNSLTSTFYVSLGKQRFLPPIKPFLKDSLSTPKPELPPIVPSIVPPPSPTPTPSTTPITSPSLMSRILSFFQNLFHK